MTQSDGEHMVSSESKLLIVCGLSFDGKGKALAERFGHEQVDVDDTEVQLFGFKIENADLIRDEDWDLHRGGLDSHLP